MPKQISPRDAAQIAMSGEEPPGEPESSAENFGSKIPGSHGDPVTEVDEQHWIVKAAMSTEPNIPLHRVESIWNPEEGGDKRVSRGIQKATDMDGMPAAVDIVVGIAEMYVSRARESVESESTGATDKSVKEQVPQLGRGRE